MANETIVLGNVTFTFAQSGSLSYSQATYDKIKAALIGTNAKDPALFVYGTNRTISITNEVVVFKPISTKPELTNINCAAIYFDTVETASGPSFINGNGNRTLWTAERLFLHEMRHVNTGLPDIDAATAYSQILTGGGSTAPDSVGVIVGYENTKYPGASNQHMDYVNSFVGNNWETNNDRGVRGTRYLFAYG